MANNYHLHPVKGPQPCRVGQSSTGGVRGCPFGDLNKDHYSTMEEANEAFQKRLERTYGLQKVVVSLDLDNTLVDFTGGFRKFLERKHGLSRDASIARYPNPKDYNFSDWFSGDSEFLENLQEAEEAGLYKDLRALKGSVKVVNRMLRDRRVDLRVVTARDRRWNSDTSENLEKIGLPPMEITNLESKEEYNAHIFIDDKDSFAENIYSGRYITSDKTVKTVIVPRTSYNEHLDPANDWFDISNQLNQTLERLTRG